MEWSKSTRSKFQHKAKSHLTWDLIRPKISLKDFVIRIIITSLIMSEFDT